jgi:hypothetical protein
LEREQGGWWEVGITINLKARWSLLYYALKLMEEDVASSSGALCHPPDAVRDREAVGRLESLRFWRRARVYMLLCFLSSRERENKKGV